jgi:5-methylcytosine-specific restriction protein A
MLCKVHHREIHFTEWIVRIRDGLPEFVPPKFIDPLQEPRRKALPHLIGMLDDGRIRTSPPDAAIIAR